MGGNESPGSRPDAQTKLPEHPDITDYRTVAEVLTEQEGRNS